MAHLSASLTVPACCTWLQNRQSEAQIGSGRFAVHKLDLPVNCDAALSAARDYFERVTREYHTKGPDGRDRSQVQPAVAFSEPHRCYAPASASCSV